MASRFLVGGGNGNWTSTTNWAATSGGSSGASAPVNGDAVTFDTNSGATNITLDTSARACTSLDIQAGYTGTMTMTFGLTVAGTCTLGANMTIAGSGALTISANGTITANGKTWPNALSFTSSGAAYTVADAWIVTGTVSIGNGSANYAFTGGSIRCNGSFTMSGNTSSTLSGSCTWRLGGTGTWSSSGMIVSAAVTIDTSGTVTLSGSFSISSTTFTYAAGTVSAGSATFNLSNSVTITANASGFAIGTISIASSGTKTFNGTDGFSIGTLSCLLAGISISLKSGNTYTITTAIKITGISGNNNSIVAATPSSSAFLIISTSTAAFAYNTITDIDASGGNAVYVYAGTLTRTANVTAGTVIGSGAGGGLMRNKNIQGGVI